MRSATSTTPTSAGGTDRSKHTVLSGLDPAASPDMDDYGYGAIWGSNLGKGLPYQVFVLQKNTHEFRDSRGVEHPWTQRETLGAKLVPQLDEEGVSFDHHILTGVMIEIPSAALNADMLAQHVDFFSTGTNDLIQYAMAADRGNEAVAHLYQPTNPADLKLMRMTVETAASDCSAAEVYDCCRAWMLAKIPDFDNIVI